MAAIGNDVQHGCSVLHSLDMFLACLLGKVLGTGMNNKIPHLKSRGSLDRLEDFSRGCAPLIWIQSGDVDLIGKRSLQRVGFHSQSR